MDNARKLLQVNMEKGLMQNMRGNGIKMQSWKPGNGSFSMLDIKRYQLELDAEKFQTFAFNTHPLAYLDAGLADLPSSDLLRIAGQPSIQEWGDPRTLKQAATTVVAVTPKKIGDALDETSDAVILAVQRLMAK